MLERLIEDWLVKANERTFQVPFCQVLAARGHRVVYVSPHGPLEQGKDVISVDPDGGVHAYQLKTGDVSQSTWRNIRGEVNDLVEIPIRHPSLPPNARFQPYLVCSGTISDPVRNDITALNDGYVHRGFPRLKTITQGELLRYFVEAQAPFFPTAPEDVQTFLKLFFRPGNERPDFQALSDFISDVLKPKKRETSRALSRRCAAALLLLGYASHGHIAAENYVAIVECHVHFLAHLTALESDGRVQPEHVTSTEELTLLRIESAIKSLRAEALAQELFLEGDILVDGPFVSSRRLMVCGWLAAWEIYSHLAEPSYAGDSQVLDFIEAQAGKIRITTEAEAAHLFAVIRAMLLRGGNARRCEKLLLDTIWSIAKANSERSLRPLPNAYYTVEDCVRDALSSEQSMHETDDFRGRSMSLGVWIDWAIRRCLRRGLGAMWHSISSIFVEEVYPDSPGEFVKWRARDATVTSTVFPRPTIWESLQNEAHARITDSVPEGFRRRPGYLLLFLLAAPHRLNRPTATVLFDALNDRWIERNGTLSGHPTAR